MKAWAWLLLGIAACAISWTYMHRVLLPWEHYVNVERGHVKHEMGDLYPRWVGTRALLLRGLNPYGPEVSAAIQFGFYDRPIEQTYDKPGFDIIDEQRFAYPVYVVFLLAPAMHIDFVDLQAWAPLFFGVLIAAAIWLWLRVLDWRPPPMIAHALMLFVLCSPQVAQGLRLRQIGLLVPFLLALAIWCIMRQRLFVAGALLAVATIKPQMVVLTATWLLVWTVGNWRKRWTLAAGFLAALGLLVGAGELLLPGWPRYFVDGLQAYSKYFPQGAKSVLSVILGSWIGGGLSALLIIALLAYAWRERTVDASSPEFVHVLSLFFMATTLVLPLLTPYNQILLLLPVLMILRDWRTLPRWGRIAFVALIVWPFVASIALLLRPPNLVSMSRTPLLPSLLLILVPFLVPLLMFTRLQREA